MIFLGTVPSTAQSRHAENPFFAKLGVGFSDYTGDFPIQNFGYPLDLQEFIRGSGFPFTFSGEGGYQFSPHLALVLGVQGGNYPIVGYGAPFKIRIATPRSCLPATPSEGPPNP